MEYNGVFVKSNNINEKYGKFKVRKDTYIYIPINKNMVTYNSFNLYNPSNYLKKIYKALILSSIKLGIDKFLYEDIINLRLTDEIKDILKYVKEYKFISLYTGTPGYSSKYTMQIMDENGRIIAYGKIPKIGLSGEYIKKEKNNLEYIKNLDLDNCFIPNIIYFDYNTGHNR